MMKIKDLKKYLKNFKDNDIVVFGSWFHDGPRYYMPNIPLCKPIIKTVDKKRYAIIGHFDDSLNFRLMVKP